MDDLIGHSLGRYHILDQLGEGGMAIVYKAYDTRLETEVAVKVIRTDNILPRVLERTIKRFDREAKALAKLTHANIVKVIDYGEYEGNPYLVMPYLPGGTLKERLKGKPIPSQEAARLLLPIARALDFAHRQGMIHRDVKPSNIIITADGDPMLTDFGIAKILDLEETLELTGTGAAVGTPEYMAPEQATSNATDHRVDVYALGVVLFEMVTGRKPYLADTPMAVLIKHASEPLPRPRQLMPEIPQAVENILLKALAKSPEDRYQTMAEFSAAMEGLVFVKGLKNGGGGKKQEITRMGSRNLMIWIIAGTIGLGLIGVVTFLSMGANNFLPPIPTNSLYPTSSLDSTQVYRETVAPNNNSSTPKIEQTKMSNKTSTLIPTVTKTKTQAIIATPADLDGRLYLAKLTPISVKVGFWELGIGEYPFSEGPRKKGDPIKVKGVRYAYGLFAHAQSEIVYLLDQKYSTFTTQIYLDGYDTCIGKARFRIMVDDKEVYRSEELTYKISMEPIEINLNIRNAKILKLITDAINDNSCDWTIWGNPYLLP